MRDNNFCQVEIKKIYELVCQGGKFVSKEGLQVKVQKCLKII